jgi:hypothetical protein
MIMISNEEWEKMMETGFEAMIQALNTFGPSETLNLLLYVSNDDPVVNHLLSKYPSVVAIGEFYSRLLVYKNKNDQVEGEIKVEMNCDGEGEVKKGGPSTLNEASKLFDKPTTQLFKKNVNSEVRTS